MKYEETPQTMETYNRNFAATTMDWINFKSQLKKDWSTDDKEFFIMFSKKLQVEVRDAKEMAAYELEEMARWKKLTGIDAKEKEKAKRPDLNKYETVDSFPNKPIELKPDFKLKSYKALGANIRQKMIETLPQSFDWE
jgi:hypothetical protein